MHTTTNEIALGPIVTAFAADPVIRWVYPAPGDYLAHFADLVLLIGGGAFTTATADCAEGAAGTALWVAPDNTGDDEAIGAHLSETVDPPRHETVFAFLEQIEAHHPDEPVWYLPFIGVDPAHQGRSVGSTLLRQGLDRADADDLPAYLEASTPRNRSLYERHGFAVVGEIRSGDSPPVWPMLRPAGARP